MKYIKLFDSFKDTISFNDKYPKFKWIELTDDDRKSFKYQLYKLIDNTYSIFGGHVRITEPSSVYNDKNLKFWRAIDIDEDPDVDIVVFGQSTKHGIKLSGWGHDGEYNSKKELTEYLHKILSSDGIYLEVAGRPAKVLLTRYKTNYVNDYNKVQNLFPYSNIKWFGKHPHQQFSDIDGFYKRTLHDGSETDIEIVLGNPRF